jgi:hypothetical protein
MSYAILGEDCFGVQYSPFSAYFRICSNIFHVFRDIQISLQSNVCLNTLCGSLIKAKIRRL